MRTVTLALALVGSAYTAAPVDRQAAQIQQAGTRDGIVGTVTTPNGTPVSGAVVTLLQRVERDRKTSWRFVDARLHVVTDIHGRYAIDNARTGEFVVVAIPHHTALGADGRVNRSGYRMTFYPSAPNPDEARPVMVNVREAQTADIRLIPAPLAVVSGVVLTSTGKPAADGALLIAHGDHLFGIDSVTAQLRSDGTFALAGVSPGTYFLQFHESAWPPPRGEMPLVSGAKVVVDGHDISGVRVAPIHTVHVEGRLLVDPGDRAQLPANLTVGITPIVSDGNPGPRPPGRVNPDLTFELDTWPGLSSIHVSPVDAGWKITRVRYRGADVTESGIDFTDGERVSGIDVELARVR